MKTSVTTPRYRLLGLVSLIMIFLAVSCNKEEAEEVTLQSVDELEIFANQLYLKAEIVGGDEDIAFYIPNDGLIDEYTANEAYFETKSNEPNKLIGCLVNVELTQEQRALAYRTLVSYRTRNHELIKAHREAVAELNQAMRERRLHLMGLVRSGEIDRVEFRRRMAELRERYVNVLKDIKTKHAFEFRRSYRFLLNQLLEILDDEQWNRFVSCMNSRSE
jgi:hypothetical protein